MLPAVRHARIRRVRRLGLTRRRVVDRGRVATVAAAGARERNIREDEQEQQRGERAV